jgi:hypothetical protein
VRRRRRRRRQDYNFPVAGGKSGGTTLRRLGKGGRLVSAYLPSRLGEPGACAGLGPRRQRLLHAVLRETTRPPLGARDGSGCGEVWPGNRVPGLNGKGKLACPLLAAGGRHAGFNGNGKRRGLGYRLFTPGGWLAKAGYAGAEAPAFLDDLGCLAEHLGLVPVAVRQAANDFLSLAQMKALVGTAKGLNLLGQVHLRVYAQEGYLARWAALFGWGQAGPGREPQADSRLTLAAALAAKGVSQRALATGVGVDPSFLGKVLNGGKPCPPGLLAKALSWLASPGTPAEGRPEHPPSASPLPAAGAPMLEVALAYRRRGWGVVPQLPGKKHPCVRWKPFQDRLPQEGELRNWFARWPKRAWPWCSVRTAASSPSTSTARRRTRPS